MKKWYLQKISQHRLVYEQNKLASDDVYRIGHQRYVHEVLKYFPILLTNEKKKSKIG